MAGNDDSRRRGGKSGNDEAAKVLQNASKARDRGEMAEAAGWYRRAAKLLLEDDQEDRALEFAKMAAELDEDVESGRLPASRDVIVEGKPTGPSGGQRPAGGRADGTGKHKAMRGAPEPLAPSSPKAGTKSRRATGEYDNAKALVTAPKPSIPLPSRSASSSPSTPPRPATPAAKSDNAFKIPMPTPRTPPTPLRPGGTGHSVPPPPPRPSTIPLPRPSAPPPASPQPATASVPPRPPTVSKPPIEAAPSSPSLRGNTVNSTPPPPPPTIAALQVASGGRPGDTVPSLPASTLEIPVSPSLPPAPTRASELDYLRARLASLPFLDELLSDRVREVARQVRLIECDDGDSLFAAGEAPGPLFAITSGTAVIEMSGEPTSIVTAHEGEVIGVVSALFGDRRRGSARARGPLEAFAFAPSLVRALALEYGGFRAYLDNIARARVAEILPRAAVGMRGLDQPTRRQLFESCEWVTIPEGALLQLEGVAAGAIYFVGAGEAEVFGPAIDARRVQRLGVGALIGAASLRDDSHAAVNVRAASRLLVARLAAAKYRRFAAAHRDAARALAEVSAG